MNVDSFVYGRELIVQLNSRSRSRFRCPGRGHFHLGGCLNPSTQPSLLGCRHSHGGIDPTPGSSQLWMDIILGNIRTATVFRTCFTGGSKVTATSSRGGYSLQVIRGSRLVCLPVDTFLGRVLIIASDVPVMDTFS